MGRNAPFKPTKMNSIEINIAVAFYAKARLRYDAKIKEGADVSDAIRMAFVTINEMQENTNHDVFCIMQSLSKRNLGINLMGGCGVNHELGVVFDDFAKTTTEYRNYLKTI